LLLLGGCDDAAPLDTPDSGEPAACSEPALPVAPMPADPPGGAHRPDPATDTLVLYELQVRSANACDPGLGSEAQRAACAAKPAPRVVYRAVDSSCPDLDRLERIRLGTLQDLAAPTADPTEGITLRYISEQVGANAVWLMPPFPNNAQVALPNACDNIGSPYAVTDYLHLSGMIDTACIEQGRDEYSDPPCWAGGGFDAVIDEANRRGVRVMLDVAFNHFGHNYRPYDIAGRRRLEPLIEAGDVAALDDFGATLDPALLESTVLDTEEQLDALVAADAEASALYDALVAACPGRSAAWRLRAWAAFAMATGAERAAFDCSGETLEAWLPAFYQGADRQNPSTGGDFYSGDWRDVKFLYHHVETPGRLAEALRVREYLFRVLNHWVSRGVTGFRLDHTTDAANGLSPGFWRYVIAKVRYYAALRGQPSPVFVAEEFFDQAGMAQVADMMTEGFLFDMNGRGGAVKDAAHVARVLTHTERFGGSVRVLTHLENHDELRLLDGTGFDFDTGAGFWVLGASTWSTPMLLAGQEYGERARLEFRRSSLLPMRFDPAAMRGWQERVARYRGAIEARNSEELRALRSRGLRVLRGPGGASTGNVFAMARWTSDRQGLVAVYNLWPASSQARFSLPADVAGAMGLDPCGSYRLVAADASSELVSCRPLAEYANGFTVWMSAPVRWAWAIPERC
jgi:hypothetical protein